VKPQATQLIAGPEPDHGIRQLIAGPEPDHGIRQLIAGPEPDSWIRQPGRHGPGVSRSDWLGSCRAGLDAELVALRIAHHRVGGVLPHHRGA
jgi:hypothetical protein